MDPNIAERVRKSFERQAFMASIGATLDEITSGRAVVRLPYDRGLTQQNGFFHGGVIGTIADVAGGYAGFSMFGHGTDVLTVEFKINLLAPANGSSLKAVGEVLRHGRTLTVCALKVFDQHESGERLCASGQQTLIAVNRNARKGEQ